MDYTKHDTKKQINKSEAIKFADIILKSIIILIGNWNEYVWSMIFRVNKLINNGN